jgi:S1-C subfamily serine protease
VQPGSAAAQVGISQGDVIREVNRAPVASRTDVEQSLARSRDKKVLLRVERADGARYIVLELG